MWILGAVAQQTETVQFVLDGQVYKADLDEASAARLRETLAPYQRVAHPIPWPGKPAPVWMEGRDRLARVREWARWHGHQVSDFGQIPQAIWILYDAAHPAQVGSAAGDDDTWRAPTGT